MTGLEFKLIRKYHGLSSREVAIALGVTEKTARNWEESAEIPEKAAYFLASLEKTREETDAFIKSFGKNFPCPANLNDLALFFPGLPINDLFLSAWEQSAACACAKLGKKPALISSKMYGEWLNGASDCEKSRQDYIKSVLR